MSSGGDFILYFNIHHEIFLYNLRLTTIYNQYVGLLKTLKINCFASVFQKFSTKSTYN